MATKDDGFSGLIPDMTQWLPKAPATFLIAFACVGVFVSIQLQGAPEDSEEWERWGVLGFEEIRRGAWWGLVASAFVHVALWHLAFNVYWLWVLGSAIERQIGTLRYVALTLAAAVVSSAGQLIASDVTGHGYSGVGYALFGFVWIARRKYSALLDVLDQRLVTSFIVWLVGCVVATQLGYANIGNAAHVTGMVFGVLVAFAFARDRLWSFAVLAALLPILTAAWLWRPFSTEKLARSAWSAHRAGDFETAESRYRRYSWLGGDARWALGQLGHLCVASDAPEDYVRIHAELEKLDANAAAELSRFRDDLRKLRTWAASQASEDEAEYWKGRVALHEWRYDAAAAHFRAQLSRTPNDLETRIGLVECTVYDGYASIEDLRAAVADAEFAVGLSRRRDALALYLLADASFRAGELERARAAASEIRALGSAGADKLAPFQRERLQLYR